MPQYSNRTVKIPKTGQIVSLRDARKAMGARESYLGQTQSALRKKLLAQRADFNKLERVVEAFNRTGKYASAGKAAGVSEKTAQHWVKGIKLPKRVSIKWSEKAIGKRKPLVITQKKAVSFAYVLGAMMGNVSRDLIGRDQKQGRLSMAVKDLSFAQEFSRKLEESTGMKTKIKRTIRGQWLVDIGSRNIIQLFNELTMYGNKIPTTFGNKNSATKAKLESEGSITQFLITPQERLEFLRALYDSHGSIRTSGPSKTRVIVIKPKNPQISKFIQESLKENKISSASRNDGTIAIPSTENRLFMNSIGFRTNAKL
ncbi:MAG: hypothetical protein AABW59_01540 [archaeon]